MIYLDNGATSFPKPKTVIDAAMENLTVALGTPGRGTHEAAAVAAESVASVRRAVAKFFGILEDYRVIFTYSATDALNMALKGFLNSGDHVLMSHMEHNSVLRPLKGLERDGVITLDIIATDDSGYLDMDDLQKKLRNKKTKLVCVSHGSNVTGAVQNAREIGRIVREQGAYFLLDAAQSAGVVPISQEEDFIDLLAFAGHKGLFGLQGTGCLILGSRIRGLRPFREGGTGFDSQSETQPVNWPEAFEAGTHNVLGITSMGCGIKFINETGMEKIAQVESEHLKALWEGMGEYDNITLYGPKPYEERVAVLSFNLRGWAPEDVGGVLNVNHGIITRTGLHCSPLAHKRLGTFPEGSVRVSPGYFNDTKDIKEFLKVIETMATIDVPWY